MALKNPNLYTEQIKDSLNGLGNEELLEKNECIPLNDFSPKNGASCGIDVKTKMSMIDGSTIENENFQLDNNRSNLMNHSDTNNNNSDSINEGHQISVNFCKPKIVSKSTKTLDLPTSTINPNEESHNLRTHSALSLHLSHPPTSLLQSQIDKTISAENTGIQKPENDIENEGSIMVREKNVRRKLVFEGPDNNLTGIISSDVDISPDGIISEKGQNLSLDTDKKIVNGACAEFHRNNHVTTEQGKEKELSSMASKKPNSYPEQIKDLLNCLENRELLEKNKSIPLDDFSSKNGASCGIDVKTEMSMIDSSTIEKGGSQLDNNRSSPTNHSDTSNNNGDSMNGGNRTSVDSREPKIFPEITKTSESRGTLQYQTHIRPMSEQYTFTDLADDCSQLLSMPSFEVVIQTSTESMEDNVGANEEAMDITNSSCAKSFVEETESSGNDSMMVNKELRIPSVRIRNVEYFRTPVDRKNIHFLNKSETSPSVPNCFPDNFETLLSDSPYIHKVHTELSNSTEQFLEEITQEKNDGNEARKSAVKKERTRAELKRENIARVLDYDSDDLDDEDDSEYVPSSSDGNDRDDDALEDDEGRNENCEQTVDHSRDEKIQNLSKDESFDISPSVNESGLTRCNLKDLHVAPSSGRKGDHKQHFCPYCKSLINDKFARHLERRHKEEDDVKIFLSMPKKSRERLKQIDSIRGKGDHIFNTDPEYNQADLIVRRRPNEKWAGSRRSEDHMPCAKCKMWYSKSTLKTHFRACTNKKSNKRSALMMSRKLLSEIHPKAGSVLREFIFPTMREGPVKDIIKYDELIIQFGNRLCKKYRSQHHHKEIRTHLRLCGRLLLNVKEINSEITDFSSLYHSKHYEDVITAVNMTGRLDPSGTVYEAPATAAQAGSLVKKLAALRKSNCIKLQLRDEKQNCEDFLHLLVDDYAASVSKTVEESQTLQKRQKSVKLPTSEDIKKLWEYLESQRKSAMKALKSKVTYGNWLSVAKPTLTSIQLFNRRRAGEVERITLEDFQKCRGINDFDKDLFKVLDEQAQKIAETYSRFVIRGKLNRIVPVLLTNSLLTSMQLLVNLRTAVGVPANNPYVFGLRHGADKNRWEWLSACTLMRNFSAECGAEDPETLRGTKLRKHIATQCILLNLNSDEVSDLANFMGHHEKIHMEHYRQPIEARDILQVSKLLEKASQGVLADGNLANDSSDENIVQDDCNTASCRNEEAPSTSGSELNSQRSRKRKISRRLKEIVPSDDEYDSEHETKKKKLNTAAKSKVNYSGATDGISENREKVTIDREVTGTNKNKRKRRSTSPYGRVKRRRWVPEEVDVVNALYAKYFRTNHYPSLRQIAEDIYKNSALKNRTPAQVKT